MIRLARFVALGSLVIIGGTIVDRSARDRSPQRRVTDQAPPTPPALTPFEIDRQDRVGRAHQRRETDAFDRRPLLALLPLEIAGDQIEIAGLTGDGRRALLNVRAPHGVGHAARTYRRSLKAVEDDGRAYDVRFEAPRSALPEYETEGALRVAQRYVMAATNWSASTYRAAHRTRTRLSTGSLLAALHKAPPTRAHLRQLRADHEVRLAGVLRIGTSSKAASRALIDVDVDELHVAAGERTQASVRYELSLRRTDGRWRVARFSIAEHVR